MGWWCGSGSGGGGSGSGGVVVWCGSVSSEWVAVVVWGGSGWVVVWGGSGRVAV
jgi:hypothetical protein